MAWKLNELFGANLPDEMPIGYLVLPTRGIRDRVSKDPRLTSQIPLPPSTFDSDLAATGIKTEIIRSYNGIINSLVLLNRTVRVQEIRKSSISELASIPRVTRDKATFVRELVKQS